jgi:hypothetical protein
MLCTNIDRAICSRPDVRTIEFLFNMFSSCNTWRKPVLRPKHVVLSDRLIINIEQWTIYVLLVFTCILRFNKFWKLWHSNYCPKSNQTGWLLKKITYNLKITSHPYLIDYLYLLKVMCQYYGIFSKRPLFFNPLLTYHKGFIKKCYKK